MFSVDLEGMPAVTSLPDAFISGPMKNAPGEYVKVLIYLMMSSHQKDSDLSTESLSRIFSCTEEDILLALNYWEKQKLLDVFYREGCIRGIRLNMSMSEKSNDSHRLSTMRVKELVSENEEARQILFAAEQYLGRTLSGTDMGILLFFMDELGFSYDLCDYLLEYCVSKGKTGIHYIEKVALSWHKNGYKTPEEAKNNANGWTRIHFSVLKAFGISGRNPIAKEIEYIDRWYKEYCFSPELISEACAITLAATGKQSFSYAEGILSKWHAKGVRTLNDVKKLNEEHKQNTKPAPNSSSKNQFHNFEQRTDDLDELERQLDRQFAQE